MMKRKTNSKRKLVHSLISPIVVAGTLLGLSVDASATVLSFNRFAHNGSTFDYAETFTLAGALGNEVVSSGLAASRDNSNTNYLTLATTTAGEYNRFKLQGGVYTYLDTSSLTNLQGNEDLTGDIGYQNSGNRIYTTTTADGVYNRFKHNGSTFAFEDVQILSGLQGNENFSSGVAFQQANGAAFLHVQTTTDGTFNRYRASGGTFGYYDTSSLSNLQGNEDFNSGFAYLNNGASFYIPVAQVPLPATTWLFGAALLGLAGARRRKQAS